LSILWRVDTATATRTSVLSKRWRDLLLLPVLTLRSWDFLLHPCPEPITAHHVDQAMSRLTKATRSLLADPSSKSTYMLQQALAVNGFFTAYPCVFQHLTKLRLYNVRFAEWDMQQILFDSCKQLKQLFLFHCDIGDSSVWQINAPDSKLRILEVLCLPKLKHIQWDEWFCFEAPLRFGSVPSLEELGLICGARVDHQEFSLSQVLHGTRNIHTLTLDFQGERLLIQPEGKQLCHAFKRLRKLTVCGIFVDFDLEYMQIWDHACQDDEQLRKTTGYEAQRTKPSWSMAKFTSSETWQLRELEFVGFRPREQEISFLRSVMERASNLKAVLLKEDEDPCEDCDSMSTPRGGFCPADKGEQEAIVRQLTDGVQSSAQIIFPNSGGS
ncbi:hypothetical protein ZWY2020_009437, partial [Hordeum vulgare]